MLIFFYLFMAGLLAGTIDAIAGGGGLISLPILLATGMPPHVAFGTNKFQSTIGTAMAALRYHRHGLISLKTIYPGLIFGLIGAITGSVTTQLISNEILQKITPFLLIPILVYTFFAKKHSTHVAHPRMRAEWFYLLFGLGLGFYDGFFGPGTGSFWVVALTFFLGYNLVQATAYTKIFNLNSNIAAALCFAIGGHIDYRYGACMAAGSLLGGQLGAYLAIKKGASLIRPLFIAVVFVTIVSLIYKNESVNNFLELAYAFSMRMVT